MTTDLTTEPAPSEIPSARPPSGRAVLPNGQRLAAAACLLVSLAVAVLAIVVLVRSTFTGYEISDEGFYLYAADPANKANVANGLWGMYLGLLYRAVGFSLVGFRIAGITLLAACAVWLGWQVGTFIEHLAGRRLDRFARAALVVSTVAAAQLYYALVILTPSYNWMALCGLMLTLAGVLAVLAHDEGRSRLWYMAPVSFGCFLAFWGRNVAGVGVWLLAQVLVFLLAKGSRRDRLRLLAAGVGTLVVLGALHATVLLSPATTLAVVNRAKSFNFTHGFSTPAGVLVRDAISQVLDAPRATYHTAGWWPLLGLAPALAWFAGATLRHRFAALASCAAVLAVGGALIARHDFDGGPNSYRNLTPAVLALVVTAALAWGCCAVLRRRSPAAEQGLPRRAVLVTVVISVALIGTQELYAFTSNNPLLGQSSGAAVLGLLAVQLLLVAAVGRERMLPAVFSVAVLIPLALTACVVSGRQSPYRDAPLADATTTVTINRHGARIRLAPEYAAYFTDLVGPAKAAGFTAGTPLVDLTPFSPGTPEVLGATAPNTLLFGYNTTTARWVLSVQNRAVWRDAWLLTRQSGFTDQAIDSVTSVVGRSFPADYQLVATATWPWGQQQHQLWRPRNP